MGNGLQKLIEKHYETAEEGTFESLMCAFALEMLDFKRKQWKMRLFMVAVVLVPIVIVILDKVL